MNSTDFTHEQFDHWIALNDFDKHSPEQLRAACAWVVEHVRGFRTLIETRNLEIAQLRSQLERAEQERLAAERAKRDAPIKDALEALGWTAPGDLPDGAVWGDEG